MIVVSDASPLIGLAAIGKLDLLQQLYGEVVIPEAVHQELTFVTGAPGEKEVAGATWVRVRPIKDYGMVRALQSQLDEGEAEAIALAIESEADLLLMDERLGRSAATRLGRRVIGVLGVLVQAKKSGHLAAVGPVIDDLTEQAGFRIGDDLRLRILEAAGEFSS